MEPICLPKEISDKLRRPSKLNREEKTASNSLKNERKLFHKQSFLPIWNTLPKNVRNAESVNDFKAGVDKQVFNLRDNLYGIN